MLVIFSPGSVTNDKSEIRFIWHMFLAIKLKCIYNLSGLSFKIMIFYYSDKISINNRSEIWIQQNKFSFHKKAEKDYMLLQFKEM